MHLLILIFLLDIYYGYENNTHNLFCLYFGLQHIKMSQNLGNLRIRSISIATYKQRLKDKYVVVFMCLKLLANIHCTFFLNEPLDILGINLIRFPLAVTLQLILLVYLLLHIALLA